MSLTIILIIAIVLTIIFHFVGVYAGAKKIVWIVLALFWAGSISIALQEIKPKGYDDLKTITGIDTELDATINEAMPKVSVYEMLVIKKKQHEQGVKVDMFGHAHKE
jgi:hypothetical protein